MLTDNRIKYQHKLWQQGEYLTHSGFYANDDWSKYEYEESCCAYINFSIDDMGLSRELVYRYDSPEECLKEVEFHNKNLKIIRLLMPKSDLDIHVDLTSGSDKTVIGSLRKPTNIWAF